MLLSLPDIRQDGNWDCGRTCLRILCSYWNQPLPTPLADLSNPVVGLSPDSLWAACLSLGFDVLLGNWTVEMLRLLTRDGKPVCCLTQLDGGGHWCLCRGVERGRVYVQCPTKGLVSQPVAEWEANWRDTHWAGSTFLNWGLCPFFG